MTAKNDLRRLRLATTNPTLAAENDPEADARAPESPQTPPAASIPTPRTENRSEGVFYIGTKVDPQSGAVTELPPLWLCDPLEIQGRGMDEAGDHYRILSWNSRGNHQAQQQAINLGMVGERQSWGLLRAGGLALASNRRALEHLSSWLQIGGADTMHSVSHRGGWNLGAYVLPSGEILGETTAPLFYNGDRSHAPAYRVRGTVESWREHVAALSRGNTRPMLAIGAALAAPLLHLVGLESGGFHLFGASGSGKSTSANVGGSVWGSPKEQLLNWDATALALANAAAARNDGLMLLDEMGQGNPEAVNTAAYRLFNGTGKMQGARDGGNRDMLRWRVLVLSTGEVDLAGFMQGGGRRTRAGQEVRLACLPADAGAGLGAFECLNGRADSYALALALEEAAKEHYGAVGRAFVTYVASHSASVTERLRDAIKALVGELPAVASGQVRRVAQRFAVCGEALELATAIGLTGWAPGEGRQGIRRCFQAWLDRYGLGNKEDEQIIEQAEGWLSANGMGRFIDWHSAANETREPSILNCAGYRRRDGEALVWLVFPNVFTQEIAQGFDRVAAAKALEKAGMLERAGNGVATSLHKTPDYPKQPRRFYRFISPVRVEPG